MRSNQPFGWLPKPSHPTPHHDTPPPPQWRWCCYSVTPDNPAVNVVDGEMLFITKVSRLHMAAYLCVASNGVPPSISKRVQLRVQCKWMWHFHECQVTFRFIPFQYGFRYAGNILLRNNEMACHRKEWIRAEMPLISKALLCFSLNLCSSANVIHTQPIRGRLSRSGCNIRMSNRGISRLH